MAIPKTYITLKNGLEFEIKDINIDEYNELLMLIENRSERRLAFTGMELFAPREIAKIRRG